MDALLALEMEGGGCGPWGRREEQETGKMERFQGRREEDSYMVHTLKRKMAAHGKLPRPVKIIILTQLMRILKIKSNQPQT